jgi:hypothetical protein
MLMLTPCCLLLLLLLLQVGRWPQQSPGGAPHPQGSSMLALLPTANSIAKQVTNVHVMFPQH